MRRGFQQAAQRRLARHRAKADGPVAIAHKALWAALQAGNMPEALRLAGVLHDLRGPVPLSPKAQLLLERLRRMRVPPTAAQAQTQVAP